MRALVEHACPDCGGSGYLPADRRTDPADEREEMCGACHGRGFINPPDNDDAYDHRYNK